MPGVYYVLSFLPVLSLLSIDLMKLDSQRLGYFDYLNAITIHTLLIGLGLFCSYLMFNNGKVPSRAYSENFIFKSAPRADKYVFLLIFFVVIIFIHQILSLRSIPFLMMFTDSSVSELTMAREGGYKLQGGFSVYFWHFSRMVFIPFLVILTFIKFLGKKDYSSFLLFLFVLFVGVFNNALSGAKAPVAMLFLCMFIAYVLLKGSFKLRYLLVAIVFIFIFPFFVEYSYSESSFIDTLSLFSEKVIKRFSHETFDRTLSYFDSFPYILDYLGGRTNSLFLLFSQESYFNVQNFIFIERIDGDVKEHLLHGSANAHFIGYMNADFGMLGVLLSCFTIGLIIGFLDVKSSSRIKTPESFALYIVMAFIFWKLMGSQPTSVLFSHGSILAFLMLLFFNSINKSTKG
ncbi:hypothetical protein CWB63_03595 [Pseudoalteromonas sp. S409]|nr:hypothetical protein CWB61_17995 [Pseudoalteromonas sp. S407]TMO01736.1 hypothetical protein CWB63_03595 [Pseudoalteromonas sp. S409]TMO10885.1 hypothetical protein CWB57_09595 [Pseudoalteromonas sp. S186]